MEYLFYISVILLFAIIFLIFDKFNKSLNTKNNITIDNSDSEDNISYEDDLDILDTYKLANKKNNNIDDDKFNIKEYDIINENIIIHNKYKTELLISKEKKDNIKLNKEKIDNEIKQQNINKINENSKKIKINKLYKSYENNKKHISKLNNLFRSELISFLNELKNNNISKRDIAILIKKLDKDIDICNKDIKNIKDNYNDILDRNEINKFASVINNKIDIFNKKKDIYYKYLE